MTQIVYVANTNVEFEYAHSSLQSLEQSWSRHPLCLQLQFLPLLYAKPNDVVAVTSFPGKDYFDALQQTGWWPAGLPQVALLESTKPFEGKECQSWGASLQVQAWAKARHMHYKQPENWQMICQVNSKAFSFRYSSLTQAALIDSEPVLLDWLQKTAGTKVLKTCFGLSGQGNRLITDSFPSSQILEFCRKEWQQGRSLIGEPWLNRLCDFSTQWFIHPNQTIESIGATRFETDSRGTYQGTLVGPENILFASLEPFLNEHRQVAKKALKEIASLGFFGFIGIDALLYKDPHTHSVCLYPLVEINARQTMSLVALRLQKRLFPYDILRFAFEEKDSSYLSLLPKRLTHSNGKIVDFRRHLTAVMIKNSHDLNLMY